MNYYYPNNFLGIPYTMPTQNQILQPNYIPSQMPINNNIQQAPSQQQNNNSTLNGKLVDGEEMVKATEVPIGSYGIFPKADFSEIFVKSWNPNGTTSVVTFKPVVVEEKTANNNNNIQDIYNVILNRINDLEKKIDHIVQIPTTNNEQQIVQQIPTIPQQKEVKF